MSKQKETAFEDFSRELEKRVGGADKLRAEELEQLGAIRRAKESGLKRERERLTQKHGEAHPLVAEFSARIETNAAIARDLGLEAARARVEVPRVDAKGWAVHGHVRDEDLKPVAGLTVALYDSRASWVEAAGFACTDDEGYFRIETREVGTLDGPLFLRVLTGQAVHLFSDPNPLTPLGGGVEYRAIVLAEGAQACTPPFSSPRDPVARPGEWVVRGRVTNAKGEGVDGLTVSLFDKDLFFDDRLGQTETEGGGYYSFTYRAEDFRDLIERKADIYLKVIDPNGETLYTSKEKIRYEAGRVEIVNARIGK
ncbi:MAG TPA: hypothetical protein VFX96_02375 [Pyrinomonadaceae bacterium]|nr:hypothetical protein [Pyrinomonadaceae bacterium]